MFLQRVHELLLGERRLLRRGLRAPRRALRGRCSGAATSTRSTASRRCSRSRSQVAHAHQHVPGPRPPHRRPRPAAAEGARTCTAELDPATYGLTIWDLDREFLTGGLGGQRPHDARRHPRRAARRLLPHDRRRVHAHPGARPEGAGSRSRSRACAPELDRRRAAPHPRAAQRGRGVREVPRTPSTSARSASASRAPRRRSRCSTRSSSAAADAGLDDVVIGMAHRGRLNVLANIVGKSLRPDLPRVRGRRRPRRRSQGSGDVKYHLGQTGKFVAPHRQRRSPSSWPPTPATSRPSTRSSRAWRGPSRTRIDDPERVLGAAAPDPRRRRLRRPGRGGRDAQPVRASRATEVGGTIHVVVNNQLGFTTAARARPARRVYSTDVAKMVQAPIFHVNGDDPEACVRVARLAFAFRQQFHKDVVDRHGLLPPLRPQRGRRPELHAAADVRARSTRRRSVRKLYTEALVKRGDLTLEEAEARARRLPGAAADRARRDPVSTRRPPRSLGQAAAAARSACCPTSTTGVDRDDARPRSTPRCRPLPDGFTVHPKLAKQFEAPRQDARADGEVDWALAEALAFGSLLLEGTPVRLAGQDTRRGTFSQRHAVLVDHDDRRRVRAARPPRRRPGAVLDLRLAALGVRRARLRVRLLGRRPGRARRVGGAVRRLRQRRADRSSTSSSSPPRTSGARRSGLVLLLPHGFEGQGPEHSLGPHRAVPHAVRRGQHPGRATRTTAAQYFHLLRRQVHRDVRKPLVVFTPKSLLRAKSARSPVDELADGLVPGGARRPGVTDPAAVAPRRVLHRQGRPRAARRAATSAGAPVAVVRRRAALPVARRRSSPRSLDRYPNATEIVWLQEEPENMGPWYFVSERLWPLVPDGIGLPPGVAASGRAARPPAATPSTSRSRTTS